MCCLFLFTIIGQTALFPFTPSKQDSIQLVEGSDIGDWYQGVATGIANQVLDGTLFIPFGWVAKLTVKEIVGPKT